MITWLRRWIHDRMVAWSIERDYRRALRRANRGLRARRRGPVQFCLTNRCKSGRQPCPTPTLCHLEAHADACTVIQFPNRRTSAPT